MNTLRSVALSLLSLALVGLVVANGQLAQGQSTDQLGTVNFQNSCGPAVQANVPARRRHAAFLPLRRGGEGLSRGAGPGSVLRDRHLGHRRAS